MRIVIFMTVLFAGCMVVFAKPDIVNPDITFNSARNYQNQIHEAPEDFRAAVEDVVVALTEVLKSSSATGLGKFQYHVDEVSNVFAESLDILNTLPDSDCKNRASSIHDDALEFSLFEITNNWRNQKPQLKAIQAKLTASIKAAFEKELVPSNQEIVDYVTTVYLPQFGRMVNTCKSLPNTAARTGQ